MLALYALTDRVRSSGGTSAKPSWAVTSSEFTRLEMIVERQSLLIEMLIRTMVEKGVSSYDELNALAEEIDAEDGKLDGRRSEKTSNRGAVHCPACGRKTSAKSPRCQWCDVEMPYAYFSDDNQG